MQQKNCKTDGNKGPFLITLIPEIAPKSAVKRNVADLIKCLLSFNRNLIDLMRDPVLEQGVDDKAIDVAQAPRTYLFITYSSMILTEPNLAFRLLITVGMPSLGSFFVVAYDF